ncbi:GTP cyclohydrolase I [Micromonospora sp. DT227]|uniref:GTP cyclohydrolase I n=1 Tax=Micromonospora sp. DT227 TaxID=3393433 RepID=UPI003CF06311
MTAPTVARPTRDLAAAEEAARAFLAALGWDLNTPSTRDTPRRMAKAYADLASPRQFTPTAFDNEEGCDQLIVQQAIPFASVCEHHCLPFVGTVDFGYLPDAQIIGLSKLARGVELFARGPQVQERLTNQIANWLCVTLQPKGVGVVVRAEHMCMRLRGAQVSGTSTVTSALRGLVLDDPRTRSEFYSFVNAAVAR